MKELRIKMTPNPLIELGTLGQSVWLDTIGRDLFTSGQLKRLIDEDGLRGITSNPSLFEKAIGGTSLYQDEIQTLTDGKLSVQEIYETLSQRDVRDAADAFRPLYDRTEGQEGYASLEVNPHLAHDAQGSMVEARRLWKLLDRPNVLIKVPATSEGLPVIKQLLTEGINVNATLLFGMTRYRNILEAHTAGIAARTSRGLAVSNVASVASFFVSRIDSLVDPLLDQITRRGGSDGRVSAGLKGQMAISCSRLAYQLYKDYFASQSNTDLSEGEAQPQRLLWASTGTKNPEYSILKYVEALIGKNTINTMPLETLEAYRITGDPTARIEENIRGALKNMELLAGLGISMTKMTQQLEDEGLDKFCNSFDSLMQNLENTSASMKRPLPGIT